MKYIRCATHLIISLSLLVSSALLTAKTPTPPVEIKLAAKEQSGQLIQDNIKVTFELNAHEKVTSLNIQAYLSEVTPGNFRSSKKRILSQSYKSKLKRKLILSIPKMKAGEYQLSIKLKGEQTGKNGFSDRQIRYVIFDKKQHYRIITAKQYVGEKKRKRINGFEQALKQKPGSPDIRLLHEQAIKMPASLLKDIKQHNIRTQLLTRPVGPSKLISKYVDQRSDQAWSPEDPITVRGRLVYVDFDGITRPIVNASVNLYDEDTGFDDHLGTVSSDWSGNWSFTVNNDDGWFANGRDLYYTFKLENSRIRVQDCDGIDSTYQWQSSVHDNLNDGIILDFGTQTGSTNTNSMQVWNLLNLAWNHASSTGGRDPGFVDSCYPESSTLWSRFWEEISVSADDNDAQDSVTHEYGHAIMYYAYGSDNPSPGGSHSFSDDSQNPSLAWSEGWGTAFALSLRPDGRYNWSFGDTGRNIENFSDGGNRNGNRNEGRVAAALIDMLDASNDDNGGNVDRGRSDVEDDNTANRVTLRAMINDTMWGNWHTDVEDFWSSLSGELSGSILANANEIMFYNYMDVAAPLSCVATKVVALESDQGEYLLTGLRKFRDQGLKGFNGGQNLINSYYRNSPEIAIILLRDSKLRHDAITLLSQFSQLGYLLTDNKMQHSYVDKKTPLVDAKMAALISSMLKRITKTASAELKRDIEPLADILDAVTDLDLQSLRMKFDDLKTKHPKVHRVPIQQSTFSRSSNKIIDSGKLDDVIKKHLEKNKVKIFSPTKQK